MPKAEQINRENNQLQPFLANHEVLITALKAAVNQVAGHEEGNGQCVRCDGVAAMACNPGQRRGPLLLS